MSDPTCPFCGRDPFHYVDNGVGMEAVAVTCCDLGDMFFRGARPDPKTIEMSWEEFRDIGHRLLSTSASERGMREALEKIDSAYPDQDLNHRDFRALAGTTAAEALAALTGMNTEEASR